MLKYPDSPQVKLKHWPHFTEVEIWADLSSAGGQSLPRLLASQATSFPQLSVPPFGWDQAPKLGFEPQSWSLEEKRGRRCPWPQHGKKWHSRWKPQAGPGSSRCHPSLCSGVNPALLSSARRNCKQHGLLQRSQTSNSLVGIMETSHQQEVSGQLTEN